MHCKSILLAALFVASWARPGLADAAIHVPAGFTLERIASVAGAREIAVTANGDLLVGTSGNEVAIVTGAQSRPHAPQRFATLPDSPAASVIVYRGSVYFGTQFGIWRAPYRTGDRTLRAAPVKIASLRTSGLSRDHVTTTLAAAHDVLFASVGSTCDACDPDVDATRATIQMMRLDGSAPAAKAVHIRNAIALAVSPSGTLWAGVAGQDELPHGHPYEIFDAVTLHSGLVDYGWPHCYENRIAVQPRGDCSHAAVARAVFPAYETPIGAAFYPSNLRAAHAFPKRYWGGAFVTLHGSWHQPPVAPRIAFVPMRGDGPARAVNWNNPSAQWEEFAGGFADAAGARIARPTGIAVGTDGSLFFADDLSGGIFRIRPSK